MLSRYLACSKYLAVVALDRCKGLVELASEKAVIHGLDRLPPSSLSTFPASCSSLHQIPADLQSRTGTLSIGDAVSVPLRSSAFDAAISIAVGLSLSSRSSSPHTLEQVLHHLSTPARRLRAIEVRGGRQEERM
eukprot:584320-Hanusia_phi.AAC.3